MFGRKEAAVGGWDRLTEETQRGKRGASFAFVSLHSVIKLIAEKKKTTQKQYYFWNVKTVRKKR